MLSTMTMERQDTFKKLSKRRVSAPATTSIGPRTQEAPVETLFLHPSVKVVSFTAQVKVSSLDVETSREEAGTAPPRSQTERTIAIGPMRIYRAPGSVAFMSCSSALQPILPRSQCWCIDETDTTYVLQVRRPTFWRIELPASTVEHQKLASDLRAAWQEVLQFEKTYCPFQRGFSVEIPEKPETPVKKKPWKPKHSPLPVDNPEQPGPTAERSVSPSERVAEGEYDSRDSMQPVPLPLQPEEATELSLETPAVLENDAFNVGAQEPLSSPVVVASVVDGIHDRYGRVSNFEWPNPPTSGWITPEGSSRAESPRRPRRHSFDTFMDPALREGEEQDEHASALDAAATEQRQNIFKLDSVFDGLPIKSTVKSGDVTLSGEAPPAPPTPPTESPDLIRQRPASASVSQAAAESAPVETIAQSETAKLPSVDNLPSDIPGAANSRGPVTPRSSIAKDPSGHENTLSPPATGLRLRVPESTRPTSTFLKRISSRDSLFGAGGSSAHKDRNGLSMNVISKIYDFLLLPMAYIIALLIRASVLLIRGRKSDRQRPEFLQYSEDEFSD